MKNLWKSLSNYNKATIATIITIALMLLPYQKVLMSCLYLFQLNNT